MSFAYLFPPLSLLGPPVFHSTNDSSMTCYPLITGLIISFRPSLPPTFLTAVFEHVGLEGALHGVLTSLGHHVLSSAIFLPFYISLGF
ncbi:hypothetical protein GDO81_026091 [Engystomops pustulosus]|uniref:Uncharacterized protein n=1 Tax=Engystomops pustulosus TaxID=76066 RepID=A0AAV6Z1F4_ENGPU|nr:hypothetical protein GDO81_026091 [Engystomops pustulosus]